MVQASVNTLSSTILHMEVETAGDCFGAASRQSSWSENVFRSNTPTKLLSGRFILFLRSILSLTLGF